MASNIQSLPDPPQQPTTPSKLVQELERIVAQECNCPASWSQHPEPLNQEELNRIEARIPKLFWEIRERL